MIDVGTGRYLRLVKAKSGKTVRRSAQLVESYRREDGMPVHRVLASLGQISDKEVNNLRTAVAASRKGKILVLCDAPAWKARVLATSPTSTWRWQSRCGDHESCRSLCTGSSPSGRWRCVRPRSSAR